MPTPRPELWLGDALRAIRTLGIDRPEEVDEIGALLLGTRHAGSTETTPLAPRPEPAVSTPLEGRPVPPSPPVAGQQPTTSRAIVASQLTVMDEVVPPWRPLDGATLPAPSHDGEAKPPRPTPLFRTVVERGILRELASTTLPSATLDLPRLVDALARVEPPRALPVVSESTTRRGLQLLVDRAPRMNAFFHDVEQVEASLTKLFGAGAIDILRFDELPIVAGAGSADTWNRHREPAPFVPIVVVTAFGRSSSASWERILRRWIRNDHAVTFLVPHDVDRVPSGLRRLARFVPWDERTSIRDIRVDKSRPHIDEPRPPTAIALLELPNPTALQLAAYAAYASRIETGLLRRLRRDLLPQAGPEVELDVWTSRYASAQDREGFVITGRHAGPLRQLVAGDPRRERAIALIREFHADASPLLQLEERLLAAPTPETELESVIRTMEEAPARTKNLAQWWVRTTPRLPLAARNAAPARLLDFVARALVRGAAPNSELPTGSSLVRAGRLLPRGGGVARLGVRLRRDETEAATSLELVPLEDGRPRQSQHVIKIPKTNPLVLGVNGETLEIAGAGRAISTRTPVELSDLDGRRWTLTDVDPHRSAIATVRLSRRSPIAVAYLLDPTIAVTCLHGVPETESAVRLSFPWGERSASILARDAQDGRWALLALEEPATTLALPLGRDPSFDAEWEILVDPSTKVRGRGAARYLNEEGFRLTLAQLPKTSTLALQGAPVLVDGRVAGHVSAAEGAGEQTSLHLYPVSALRRRWANAHASDLGGIVERLGRPNDVSSRFEGAGRFPDRAPTAFALGDRTFLTPVQTNRIELLDGTVLHCVGREIGLFLSVVVERSHDGSRAPRRDTTLPSARDTYPIFGFCDPYADGLTFVSVNNEDGTYALMPCAIDANDNGIFLDLGHETRLSPGSPVFQDGRLVGVVQVDEYDGRSAVFTTEHLLRRLGTQYLEPEDWRRIAKRAGTADSAEAVLLAIFSGSLREGLQFALTQAVRRLEATQPAQGNVRLRARFVLDDGGLPAHGNLGYRVHLSVASPFSPERIVYAVASHPHIDEYQAEVDVEVSNNVDVSAELELVQFESMRGERTLHLRESICDLLDEELIERPEGNVSAIAEAIDELRIGRRISP